VNRFKASGSRGSWFASFDDEQLPCVHKYWLTKMHHADPNYVAGDKKWDELVDAIFEKKKVILTNDEAHQALEKKGGMAFSRTGYVGVYRIDKIFADDESLRFDLIERLA
jgi:hypothetical protein